MFGSSSCVQPGELPLLRDKPEQGGFVARPPRWRATARPQWASGTGKASRPSPQQSNSDHISTGTDRPARGPSEQVCS